MNRTGESSVVSRFSTRLRAGFHSLESRLIGALLLIVVCAGVLQIISQDRAFRLRDESEELRVAAGEAEHADQLLKVVVQFRLAARLHLNAGKSGTGAADELTDGAMRIGEQINTLRIGGMPLYDFDMRPFDGIDRHVAAIDDAAHDGTREGHAAIDARNAAMASLAGAIQRQADARRDAAFARLSASARSWQQLVAITGGITILVVLLILCDLLSNILPALRRMHATLRRLAAGDLDFEVEEFRLRELRALSGSLEIFRRNAQAVQNLAFTDPSTGLPNRRAFVDRAGARVAAGGADDARGLVVILADVDRFKDVNDDYGHAAGDLLVKLIGARLAGHLGEDAVVARVGGDEFAICAALDARRNAATLGAELVAAMRTPFDLGDCDVAVSISLGLVETRGGATAPEIGVLMNRADLALYASKKEGRNRATCFTPEIEEERELDRALERDLAQALACEQLRMVYQPIHAMRGGEQEVEALVRWRHPTLGEISPARFIPAAERSGLMVQLGQWIVETALGDLVRWPRLTMSINLSPLQLQQDGFVAFLLGCCRDNRIAPRRVILEVTESFSIERNARALLTLTLLRNAGFRIALDDFGTGYSSLCMMKTFRFDRLKLDRSLISDLGKDATSQAVFEAAVTMALRIGAEVVAEGISEEHLLEPVRTAGCTHVQGFHYSHPIESDGVAAYYRPATRPRRKVA